MCSQPESVANLSNSRSAYLMSFDEGRYFHVCSGRSSVGALQLPDGSFEEPLSRRAPHPLCLTLPLITAQPRAPRREASPASFSVRDQQRRSCSINGNRMALTLPARLTRLYTDPAVPSRGEWLYVPVILSKCHGKQRIPRTLRSP